jgi:hypothetical protein
MRKTTDPDVHRAGCKQDWVHPSPEHWVGCVRLARWHVPENEEANEDIGEVRKGVHWLFYKAVRDAFTEVCR